MPKELELPQFPLLTSYELEVLHRQELIRVVFLGGSSYGHETASLRVAYWLRSNGYQNWIEIVYSDMRKPKLEMLLGFQRGDMPDAFYSEEYKIAVLPQSSFESAQSRIEYTNLGFAGASTSNYCKIFKTKVFIGMLPYLWNDRNRTETYDCPVERLRTRVWRLGSDQPSIQENSETLAIRQEIPTLGEALLLLKKLLKKSNNTLPQWLPGMVQRVQNSSFLVMSVYGIVAGNHANNALMTLLMGMKQAKIVSEEFNQKPKLVWCLHKLDEGDGLEELQSKIKVLYPELLPTDVRIIPFNSSNSYVEKTLKNMTHDTIIIVETGPLPTPIFNAIYTSCDTLAIQEGPNSANVLLNALKVFLRCRKGSPADYYWGKIDLTKASPHLRDSLIEAHKLLCIDEDRKDKMEWLKQNMPQVIPEDFPENLGTAIERNFHKTLGYLISESLNPNSELSIFFRELSIQSFRARPSQTTDRIALGLSEAIAILRQNNLEKTVLPTVNSIYTPVGISLNDIELLGFPALSDKPTDGNNQCIEDAKATIPVDSVCPIECEMIPELVPTSGAASIRDSSWFNWLGVSALMSAAGSVYNAAKTRLWASEPVAVHPQNIGAYSSPRMIADAAVSSVPPSGQPAETEFKLPQYNSDLFSQVALLSVIFRSLRKSFPYTWPWNRNRVLTEEEAADLQKTLDSVVGLQQQLQLLATSPAIESGFLADKFNFIARELNPKNRNSMVAKISKLLAKDPQKRIITGADLSNWQSCLEKVQEYLQQIKDLNLQFAEIENQEEQIQKEHPDEELTFTVRYDCVNNKLRVTFAKEEDELDKYLISAADAPAAAQLTGGSFYFWQPGQVQELPQPELAHVPMIAKG